MLCIMLVKVHLSYEVMTYMCDIGGACFSWQQLVCKHQGFKSWALSKRRALHNKCSLRISRLIVKETLWMHIVVVRNRITNY